MKIETKITLDNGTEFKEETITSEEIFKYPRMVDAEVASQFDRLNQKIIKRIKEDYASKKSI